jgi:lambda family phage portal protein
MVHLDMLDRLWTSTLATANAEADRIGVIKGAPGLPPEEMDNFREDENDPRKSFVSTADVATEISSEMAQFYGIPVGLDVEFPAPSHPNSVLEGFTKFLLKGIASGLQVSYHSLAGDVAEANYSSLRAALLLERDSWRKRQGTVIRRLHTKINDVWAWMSWMSGRIPLKMPPGDFCRPVWWPRTWDWVDPLKDINAELTANGGNVTTFQDIYGKRGQDWRERFRQKKTELDYAAEIGLDLKALSLFSSGKPYFDEDSKGGTLDHQKI